MASDQDSGDVDHVPQSGVSQQHELTVHGMQGGGRVASVHPLDPDGRDRLPRFGPRVLQCFTTTAGEAESRRPPPIVAVLVLPRVDGGKIVQEGAPSHRPGVGALGTGHTREQSVSRPRRVRRRAAVAAVGNP